MENQELVSLLLSQATSESPIRYANLIRATKAGEIGIIRSMLPELKKRLEEYEHTAKNAKIFYKQVSGEGYARLRRNSKNIFKGIEQQPKAPVKNVDISYLLYSHYENICMIYETLVQGADLICNANMISLDDTINKWSEELSKSEDQLGADRVKELFSTVKNGTKNPLQSLSVEQQINRGASTSFNRGIAMLEQIPSMYQKYLTEQARNFEFYYEKLRNRHSDGGTEICELFPGNPSVSLTDVAVLVWENIDKVGEIESGHSIDELSAYTVHRAHSMIEAAKSGTVWPWIIDPAKEFLYWAKCSMQTVKSVKDFVIKVKQILGDPVWKILSQDPEGVYRDFEDIITSLDLSQITKRPADRAFSKTEKFAMDHRNKSIKAVSELLINGAGLDEIVNEILKLKVEERNFFIMENSFYVTRIGTGNMLTGEAPGAIEVIPGEKPNVNLENIWGEGFDEIRDFISGMDDAKKWSPLFLATSPSKSTDKNNVLLVGPQGCGKTEILRAMGADNESIAIFAVGSDFLTAWMGESQKNPKRLFDEAVKLHKSSGRPVHILIDEIDMVLNNDRHTGTRINLSLEFQNLMDGVVAYPGISIWGATNHVDRIPVPMIRRFAKVMVVGELSSENRISILKYYIEHFLPCGEGFSDEIYRKWSEELDGATGDVLRKVVDEVWLKLMRSYISDYPEKAEVVLEFIRESYGDNFDISDLTNEDREKIKDMIAEDVLVTYELVAKNITNLLDNFAVQKQIKTAQETYKNAKLMLERQKNNISLGF